jgi:DNA-binding NarL/FixJ family response regulator
MKSVRVLLADDHAALHSGTRQALEEIPDVDLVGEAATGTEAFDLAQQLTPDIVVLDLGDPGTDGVDATFRFQREMPQIRVAIVSTDSSDSYVLEALGAGAAGYLLKQSASEELPLAIRAISAGESFLSPAISRQVINGYLHNGKGAPSRAAITPRQREVLRLVVARKTSREIAGELGLSVRTVETHRADLMARLGVNNAAQLMREAVRLGLVDNAPDETPAPGSPA